MRVLKQTIALACCIAAASLGSTAYGSSISNSKSRWQRLLVGRTNIACAQRPCPQRGVRVDAGLNNLADLRGNLLYADMDGKSPSPMLEGTVDDRARVSEAWQTNACIAIEGALRVPMGKQLPTLQIRHVLGDC